MSPIQAHTFPLRVYFEDTDAGQVVYHASYLRFAERARTEMLRDWGYPHSLLIETHGLMFVVARVEVDYLSPGKLDDLLTVTSRIVHLGRSSVRMTQDIAAENGTMRAKLLVRLVAVNKEGRPSPLPQEFLEQTGLALALN